MFRIKKSSDLLPAVQRGKSVNITVDGKPIEAYQGETVAAAMLAAGIRTFNKSHKHKQPRSLYCGMGVCYECLVTINGVHAQRACVTNVEEGMVIETERELEL
jgi:sarcosine oxidase subunit alpha